jgi:hypothetical protein
MVKFQYKQINFVVQAYLENDLANICEINGESFRIDFYNKKITTSAKETKDWKEKASRINIEEITEILKNLFSFKYCQSNIEDKEKCKIQCDHCKEYFKKLENK